MHGFRDVDSQKCYGQAGPGRSMRKVPLYDEKLNRPSDRVSLVVTIEIGFPLGLASL